MQVSSLQFIHDYAIVIDISRDPWKYPMNAFLIASHNTSHVAHAWRIPVSCLYNDFDI